MKRIAIIGSRDFKRKEIIEKFVKSLKNAEIVSGGAEGVDAFAEQAAKDAGFPAKIFRPNFSKGYNASEYHKRNKKIAEYADEIHIFWHKPTRGSMSTLRYAVLLKKPCFIHKTK